MHIALREPNIDLAVGVNDEFLLMQAIVGYLCDIGAVHAGEIVV